MPPHPANKGPGHHPAQHTRSQAVLGPHGARRKTPGEMGWVLLGGTITTLGQAAIDNGSWPSAARHAGNPPPPPPNIKRPIIKTPAPASVRSFKQQLKEIEKRYQCLEQAPLTIPPAQAALQQQFLAARPGAEDPLMLIATTMDAIAVARRSPSFRREILSPSSPWIDRIRAGSRVGSDGGVAPSVGEP